MTSGCKECSLFLLKEKERIKWYETISLQNITLHRKIIEQEDLILVLKQKLSEKRINFIAGSLHDIDEINKSSTSLSNTQGSTLRVLENSIKEKLQQIDNFVSVLNKEKESCQRIIEENEKYHSEHVSYLSGIADYFRDALFAELNNSNNLKQYFVDKISGLSETNRFIIWNTIREEEIKMNNELKLRYRKALQKSKDEIERQSQLVSKLRKHNRQLYSILRNKKKEYEDWMDLQQKKLASSKQTIEHLRKNNTFLQNKIQLQVEGCQNDIFDTRKKLRSILNPKT